MEKMRTVLKALVFILFVGGLAASCGKDEDPYAKYTPAREAGLIKEWITKMTASGKNVDTIDTNVYYIIDKAGTGEKVKSGNEVTVKYTGMFVDGTIFDGGEMTYKHLGADSRLIAGWEKGIELLNKDARAVFLFPSEKAYGASGYSKIPPYSPLLFIIEVVGIK